MKTQSKTGKQEQAQGVLGRDEAATVVDTDTDTGTGTGTGTDTATATSGVRVVVADIANRCLVVYDIEHDNIGRVLPLWVDPSKPRYEEVLTDEEIG